MADTFSRGSSCGGPVRRLSMNMGPAFSFLVGAHPLHGGDVPGRAGPSLRQSGDVLGYSVVMDGVQHGVNRLGHRGSIILRISLDYGSDGINVK